MRLDELASLMGTAWDQALPANLQERRNLLRKLHRLKAIRVDPEADLQSAENWLFVRPMILTLVSPEWIDAVNQKLESVILGRSEPDADSSTESDRADTSDVD